jgi:hypothetical protein
MAEARGSGWAMEEFSSVALGDRRLDQRLVKLCDNFSESPESSINHACADWAETKAAYRFFRNEHVDAHKIMEAHSKKTAERARKYERILAIQDTSYLVYTSHSKTTGLGKMSLKEGKHVKKIYSKGLLMHSSLAVTTEGLPLGLLDQKIFARELNSEKSRKHKNVTPIEEKESCRWLESLGNSKRLMGDTQIVTVCDREADMYEFFKLSEELQASVLVRANVNRAVNKKSRYAEKDVIKLWDHIGSQPCAGTFQIEVPTKSKTKHSDGREARVATMGPRFGSFQFNAPRNNIKHRNSEPPNIEMCAVYVHEKNPPDGGKPLEWMLLTNLKVSSFEEAYEKVQWYCLRWRIEMYHKVLKSGFRVEECRLSDAARLIRYLTVMSIIAWRLFMVTLIARTDPDTACTTLLADAEWKVLYLKVNKGSRLPNKAPTLGNVVIWIARLGGFLARRHDGKPGTITLWRGWKRLTDLTDGWELARQC